MFHEPNQDSNSIDFIAAGSIKKRKFILLFSLANITKTRNRYAIAVAQYIFFICLPVKFWM